MAVASQKSQQSQGLGGPGRETQNGRHVWTFASHKCQQLHGAGPGRKRQNITFGLLFGRRISKVSTVTGIRRVLVAKRKTVVTFARAFGLQEGERRGDRRGERREERDEARGEKREERGERREERDEARGEKREERGEKREMRRKERRERREERRER